MQMRQQLRYEEHLNMYPVAMQHSVYTIRTTLKVKGDECFFFFFLQDCYRHSPLFITVEPFHVTSSDHMQIWQTYKYVAHEP